MDHFCFPCQLSNALLSLFCLVLDYFISYRFWHIKTSLPCHLSYYSIFSPHSNLNVWWILFLLHAVKVLFHKVFFFPYALGFQNCYFLKPCLSCVFSIWEILGILVIRRRCCFKCCLSLASSFPILLPYVGHSSVQHLAHAWILPHTYKYVNTSLSSVESKYMLKVQYMLKCFLE